MANFTGNQIRHTYQRLLQLDNFITQNGTGSINLEKVHVSGSVYVTGSQVISENLRVLGNVTAQQFIATTVSSSIVYESGSSQFGNSLDDNHIFTGSLNLTGSMNLELEELNLDGTFRHTGSLIHSGTLSIVSTGDIDLTGNITQSGNVELTGNLTQTGTTVHTGDLARSGNTALTGSLLHSGSTVAEGTYEVKEGIYGSFFANPQTLDKNVTIPANYNSRIFGPITVAAGKTLTVGANAKLEITDI